MGIDFRAWLTQKLIGDRPVTQTEMICADIETNMAYQKLAIHTCKALIAKTLTSAEFLTFEKGKEKRGDDYYLLNVAPNMNESASVFWAAIVEDLMLDDHALLVRVDRQWHRALSWERDPYALKENLYKSVEIGDRDKPYLLRDTFAESDVVYLKWRNESLQHYLNAMGHDYAEMIRASQKERIDDATQKVLVSADMDYPQTDEAQKELRELISVRMRDFLRSSSDAALTLTRGLMATEFGNRKGEATRSNDTRQYIDDVYDIVAMAIGIPTALVRGDMANTDVAVRQFMTFTINPLAKLITDGVNRAFYDKRRYLDSTYVKLDTSRIRTVDIKDIAGSLDILLRTGSHTIDDNRRVLGKEPLGGEIGNQTFMTKNYAPVEEVMDGES